MAVTENNNAYGFDPVSGAIRWTRASDGRGRVGDRLRGSRPQHRYHGDAGGRPRDGNCLLHGQGQRRARPRPPELVSARPGHHHRRRASGFPTPIAGTPSNDPTNTFNPRTAMHVRACCCGGACTRPSPATAISGPMSGTSSGSTRRPARRPPCGRPRRGREGGRGHLAVRRRPVSDGPRRIFLTTGNGVSPRPGPGTSPTGTLAESVVRLQVNSDGSLGPRTSSARSTTPTSTRRHRPGVGQPDGHPRQFRHAAHPHLIVQVGKEGKVYLLDRDNLGGTGQGPGGTAATLQTLGPYNGVWGHPAFWGGDGGYVYLS